MQTTNDARVLIGRRRETTRARATTDIVSTFRQGGFDDASPVCGEQTTLRPVEEHDVDRLLAWHADPEVSRFWDDETFTRESMLARLARPDVTPYLVLAADAPIGSLQVWGDAEAGGLDMFLEPSARGRGLGPDAGAAMARHLLVERGWARVTVDPYAWNVHALRAWRKAGFVDVSRHEPDDEHTADWVLLEFSKNRVR
jgi:aminoglycoside 6'-N-acetyltransferase